VVQHFTAGVACPCTGHYETAATEKQLIDLSLNFNEYIRRRQTQRSEYSSPKQLNGKGLRTRLKVLGKSTNGGASVLRQRLCEALEVSAAPPAAAASAAAAAAVPTAAAAAPPAAAAAAAAAVMMDLAD
jgi:hypothetical protein